MAPAIWLVNFALICTLNPEMAAFMPAYWAPIPATVGDAILRSPKGKVRYSRFESRPSTVKLRRSSSLDTVALVVEEGAVCPATC